MALAQGMAQDEPQVQGSSPHAALQHSLGLLMGPSPRACSTAMKSSNSYSAAHAMNLWRSWEQSSLQSGLMGTLPHLLPTGSIWCVTLSTCVI